MRFEAWRIYKRWPHTNPQEAAELAGKANVKQLALVHFHAIHYPSFEDRDKAEAGARKIFENTIATRDGMEITL
jgi:ribonuclease BN (tRNA processing enzyme)